MDPVNSPSASPAPPSPSTSASTYTSPSASFSSRLASVSRLSLREASTIPSTGAAVDARPLHPGLVNRAAEISPTKPSRPRRHLSSKSASAVPTLSTLNARHDKPASRLVPKMSSTNGGTPSAAADLLRQAMMHQK